jgi:outer membrane protein assembly factor BamE (lipoprotein component of BamABCDE complex)
MRLLTGTLILILLTGCNTLKQQRQRLINQHDWSQSRVADIRSGVIRVGFTPDQVRAAWGKPADVNRTVSENYTQTQWVYYKLYSNGARYVYFRNGRATSMQNF